MNTGKLQFVDWSLEILVSNHWFPTTWFPTVVGPPNGRRQQTSVCPIDLSRQTEVCRTVCRTITVNCGDHNRPDGHIWSCQRASSLLSASTSTAIPRANQKT